MTAASLAVYGVLLAVAIPVVLRRPAAALYLFILGLPLHNLVMSLLYGGGVRGGALDAIQAWKEILLASALLSVAVAALRARTLPFSPGLVDYLALVFAAFVVLYAIIPQSALGGHAGARAVLYGLRHDLVLVAAYFLGRSVRLDIRRLRWTIVGAAAAVAAWGLIEVYAVPIEWWRHSGAVGYFHRELGYDYHGPAGLPENFAFNTSDGLFRRLVSTFVSPLATAYMLVVALLLLATTRRRLRLAAPLAAVCAAGLLWTFSRSSIVALAIGLIVLALAWRRWWPLPAAVVVVAAGLGFAAIFHTVAPRTHWFASDLPYQQAQAKAKGPLPKDSGLSGTYSIGEPSFRSHLNSLRDGIKTVAKHPQGYGLGNAGTTAQRFHVRLEAGESNYTELGVETGLAGALAFIAWSLALLAGLVRAAWSGDRAAAAIAAALAAVLALAIQSDVIGVPWLAYCLWWLAGSLVYANVLTKAQLPASSHSNGSSATASRSA
jgi:O-Antigen ligase